ncbi:MAG: adenine deaminase [Candidatus Aenigmarchaeota archaeon]|nr:adenine deaminase [Candidatus Aenigmarchaeota archaeon]
MFSVKGKIVDVISGKISDSLLSIENGKIISEKSKPEKVYDFSGFYIVPGFIDAHVHIESSLMTPSFFAAAVLPHGTAAVVTDPHEIANVAGMEGIEFMMRDSETLPLKVYFTAPSCVPATNMETSGAALGAKEIAELMKNPRVVGLGEMMNFPGVLHGDSGVMEKIRAAKKSNKGIDGHCPGLRGKDLKKYITAGMQSDHECTSPEESREKLSLGMHIMIREGSAMKNLDTLLPIVNEKTWQKCMFVSDDIHPETILKEGHIDRILRKAVSLGMDPVTALRMVTINPAKYFSLKDLGSLEKGKSATFVILRDLKSFEVVAFFIDGQLVFEKGKLLAKIQHEKPSGGNSVRLKPFLKKDLMIPASSPTEVRVIKIPDERTTARLPSEACFLNPDLANDILPLAVLERHKATGNIGRGFVNGFSLKSGALASTVAHDSHNIICVGANYDDMVSAIDVLENAGGGLVAVKDRRTLAILELPVAGLMSGEPAEKISTKLDLLHSAARKLGCPLESPYMVLAFLALPVIPKLKLTDKGLVDVEAFRIVDVKV